MNDLKKNITFLKYSDGLRVFSIIAVIMLHTSAVRVANWPQLESVTWWVSHVFDSMCRWAVPVFIMLSGALILDLSRPYTLCGFYKKRFVRVVIPFLFWASFYYFWSYKSYGMNITPDFIKKSLWQGLTYNHLYFVFIILGLYAVVPVLRLLLKYIPLWNIWILVAALFVVSSSGILFRYLPMNGLTRFVPYLSYFLLGYLIRLRGEKIKWRILFIPAFVSATTVIIFKTYLLVSQFGRDDYRAFAWYDHFSVGVIIQSLCVFLFAQTIFDASKETATNGLIKLLSPVAFGIYLIHVVFLDVLRTFTSSWCEQWIFFTIILEVLLVFIASSCACLILRRIPLGRALIGL